MTKNFFRDESGAVTVDWVVLTASLVGIAIAVLLLIAGGLNSASNGIGTQLASTGSVADLIDGNVFIGSLSDYNLAHDESDHAHYEDSEGTRYRHDKETGEFIVQDTGEPVGTVDDDGNISAPS